MKSWRVHGGSARHGDSAGVRLEYDPEAEGGAKVRLEWSGGPLNDLVADAVAATLLQLQATRLAAAAPDATADAEQQEPPAEAAEEGAGGGGLDADGRRARVLKVLGEHFGEVSEVADATPRAWELVACGKSVRLHAAAAAADDDADVGVAPPFARVECDDEGARERIERVVAMAHRATLPMQLLRC